MFTRSIPNRNVSGHSNIVSSTHEGTLASGTNISSNTQTTHYNQKITENTTFLNSERNGTFDRVNSTTHSSTRNLAQGFTSEHKVAGNTLGQSSTLLSGGNVFQTQPSTTSGYNYNGRNVIGKSTSNQKPFVASSIALTPIRSDAVYTSAQTRTPLASHGISQNAYFSNRTETNSIHGNRTPIHQARPNVSNNGQLRLVSDQSTVRYSNKADIPTINQNQSYRQYEKVVTSSNQYVSSSNPYNLPTATTNYKSNTSTSFTTNNLNKSRQEYNTQINTEGLRKITGPAGAQVSNTKSSSSFVHQTNNLNTVKRQIFATQQDTENISIQQTPKSNARLHTTHEQSVVDTQHSVRSSVRQADNTVVNNQNIIIPTASNQLPSHRSNHSQAYLMKRPVKTKTQRMSLGSNFVEQNNGSTPIRASLRKQSQPSQINLTFNQANLRQHQNEQPLPYIEEKVNTDRKQWKPLVPENEQLIQKQTTIGGKATNNVINYTTHRSVTPTPLRNNYSGNHLSRPLNRAQNVQSMGRIEKNLNPEKDSKIKSLEEELAKLKLIVENLQKEKDLALKFNQLLLLKLGGAGDGVDAEVL